MSNDFETLEPFQLADLLGVDRGDVGFLTSAPVRLPKGWAEEWRGRRGPLELKATEVAFLVGCNLSSVQRWCQGKGQCGRRLAARRVGRLWRISPAALIAYLKGPIKTAPIIVETPAQRDRRAQADKAAAAELCGTGRRKPRAT